MPDAMADRLVKEQLDEMEALDTEAHEDDVFEARFEVICQYHDRCKTWLATELDDARLLFSMWHHGLMPLTFRLAQLLAPDGAILELRVTPCPTDPGPSDPPGVGAPPPLAREPDEPPEWMEVHPPRFVKEAWDSAAVVDVTNQVVYTLDESYFSAQCLPAHQFIQGKQTVRCWLKDGGIPFAAYLWLRRRLPLDLVRDIQAQLVGRDVMPIPKWLDYADATESNWLSPRRLSYFPPGPSSMDAWSCHHCVSKCHPADGHCAKCDAYHTIDEELVSHFGELANPHVGLRRRTQLKDALALLSTRSSSCAKVDLGPHTQGARAALAAALQEEEA